MKRINTVLSLVLYITGIIITAAAIPISSNDYTMDSHKIITGLFKSIDTTKTLKYKMVYSERLAGGKIHVDSNQVKYQISPLKIYVKTSDETEILWPADTNKSYAWVHPNSFPYITLKLDPDGNIMRKNQHHGIQSSGYEYFSEILKQAANKKDEKFDSHFLYLGEFQYNGVKCYKLDVIEPDFKYVPYTVLKGETIISIARKKLLSEYMIMEHNNLTSNSDLSAGQTIMIPNNYAKEMVLYINKSTMLPLFIKVDDNNGMFEQYIFCNVKANVAISTDEFSKLNKSYHF